MINGHTHKQAPHVGKRIIVRELSEQNPNFDQKEISKLLGEFFDLVSDHVYAGDAVRFNNFGTFRPLKRKLPKNFVNAPINRNRLDPDKEYFKISFDYSRSARKAYTDRIAAKSRNKK